jgi:hypothetical protein
MHEVRLTPVEASYVKGLQSHLMSKCSRRDTPSFEKRLNRSERPLGSIRTELICR